MNITRLTLLYFWNTAKKYPWLLTGFFLFTGLAVFGQEVLVTILLSQIFDLFNSSLDSETVKNLISQKIWLLLGVNLVFTFLCWRISDVLNENFQPKGMRDIENDCFEKLQNHSYSFFANSFSGGLVSKVNRLATSFERVADIIQYNLFGLTIKLIGALGFIFWYLPTLGWIFVGWIVAYTAMTLISNKIAKPYWSKASTLDTKVTASLADSLSNIFNVKIFAKKKHEENRFWEVSENRRIARRNAWMTGTIIRSWQSIMMISFEAFTLFWMLNSWQEGIITLGTIFGIQMFIWLVFSQLWELGRIFQDMTNALADSEEMIQILHQTPNLLDAKNPEKCKISEGSINFDNVSFVYNEESKENKIFDQFDLQISAGQKIGIVGESGAGKSTLVNLLLRFMDTTSGNIKIDNQAIDKITQDDLRRNIAYVPQESILFHRTLRENIAYGKPDATDIEIIEAAKKAHAHEFIQKFEEGYETLVGERGVKLSGGQKQRVAIARAMLKPAPILILDEATSALDSESEKKVQDALLKLIEGKTVLAIAHRLSTLKHMDRIIVMDNGKIIEDGSHQELLKAKGKYADLWAHQSEGFV